MLILHCSYCLKRLQKGCMLCAVHLKTRGCLRLSSPQFTIKIDPSAMDHDGNAAAAGGHAAKENAAPARSLPVLGLKRRPAFNAPTFAVKKVEVAAPGATAGAGGGGAARSTQPGASSDARPSGEARYLEVTASMGISWGCERGTFFLAHGAASNRCGSCTLVDALLFLLPAGALLQVPALQEAAQEQVLCRRHLGGLCGVATRGEGFARTDST